MSTSITDLATVLGLAAVAAAAMTGLVTFFVQVRRTKYDDRLHRIELELLRKSLEGQIYSLNDKLLATESRWRDVNHLLISSQSRQPDTQPRSVQLTAFLQSAGLSPEDVVEDDSLVFVLTPFHPRYKESFEAVSLACQELGLRALRGDEQYIEGDVFPHVLRLIAKSRLIVANIEGRNANVYYELGIAHGLGKQTILVSHIDDETPFDLRTKRLILYRTPEELRARIKDEIARSFSTRRS